MLSEGAQAPAVELPGYVDGERTRVDLDEYVGEGIVVLAFYPADFNPACSMQESDLGDLDLFTMQKDVSVFGVSTDSTYSHEAFAERYSLQIPLLSDPDGEATAAYDVGLDTGFGEHLCQRAAFVIDHHGTIQYAWATDDLQERVDVDPVTQAVGSIGGDDTAVERYRVGYDHYIEGREAFTEAMAEYEEREWLVARGEFEAAEPAFAAAADHFNTAVRFAESADFETVADRAEEKADALQHASDWLAESADALGSGRGKQGNEYREDAQRLLDAAGDLPEPPAGDAVTLTGDGVELDGSTVVDPEDDRAYALQGDDADAVDTDLGVDDSTLDAAVDSEMTYDDGSEGDTVEGDLDMDLDAIEESEGGSAADADDGPEAADTGTRSPTPANGTDGDDGTDGDGVAADVATPGGAVGANAAGSGGDQVDDSGDGADTEADVEELDLADPTEMEDDDGDDERENWDIPGQ